MIPNQRVKCGARSRQGVFKRNWADYIWRSLARSDWSARVRPRSIDWLGTTSTGARMYKCSFQNVLLWGRQRMRAPISGVYLYSKEFQWIGRLIFFCNLFSKHNKFLFKNRAILHTKYFFVKWFYSGYLFLCLFETQVIPTYEAIDTKMAFKHTK